MKNINDTVACDINFDFWVMLESHKEKNVNFTFPKWTQYYQNVANSFIMADYFISPTGNNAIFRKEILGKL